MDFVSCPLILFKDTVITLLWMSSSESFQSEMADDIKNTFLSTGQMLSQENIY